MLGDLGVPDLLDARELKEEEGYYRIIIRQSAVHTMQ